MRLAPIVLAAALLAAALASPGAASVPPPPPPPNPYPMAIIASRHVGLFHWLDSLAGTSGGKTIGVYRKDFATRFHRLTPEDQEALRKFRLARILHAEGGVDEDDGDENGQAVGERAHRLPPRGSSAMLGAFLQAESMKAALGRLEPELPARRAAGLQEALGVFSTRYDRIWDESDWVGRFIQRIEQPRTLAPLQAYLAQMASFYGVSASDPPRPRLVIVPVPAGGGTHAQAVGTDLLIEIRPGDDPAGQASVIAHENAHFLFKRIPEERLERLEQAALRAGRKGGEVWAVLHEALPTALGQGVAAARFQPRSFTMRQDWYHIAEVDRLAKRIYPIVDRALADGWGFDERLVGMMVRAAEGTAGVGAGARGAPER